MTSLPRRSPSDAGLRAGAVHDLLDALAADDIEMHSLMVVRSGHVLAEGWWGPYDPDRRHLVYSLSKMFTSMAVGLAVAEGAFGLDDPVLDHLGEFAPAHPTDHARAMTVRHLLTMATGHEADMIDPTQRLALEREDPELLRAFFALPPEREPGTVFTYNQLATYTLARLVERHAGGRLVDYLRPRLFRPLGVADPAWLEFEGHDLGFSGLHVRTEDIAALGVLLADGGRFGGEQVVPAEYVESATRVQQPNDPAHRVTDLESPAEWTRGYGFQFWMNTHGFRGDGAFGQFCVVWPEEDVVIATTACTERMDVVLDRLVTHLRPGFAPLSAGGGEDVAANGRDEVADAELADRLGSLALPTPGDAGDPRGEGAPAVRPTSITGSLPDPSALSLTPGEDGWALRLAYAGGEVDLPIGRGAWADGQWVTALGRVPFAAAGGWSPDGRFVAELRMVETPHTLTLTLDPAGDRADLTWDHPPLHGVDPAAHVLPEPGRAPSTDAADRSMPSPHGST